VYCILNENIALRSWRLVPFACYYKGSSRASGLSEEEFHLLLKCDGKTEVEENGLSTGLLERGMISRCEKGEKTLSRWQTYRDCDNRYMPMMNLQITGRCNYNCMHCFNCRDNTPLQSEISLEKIGSLLDDCEKCGIGSFTITGGEPMLHPHFKEIMREIYKRGMFVFDLNTNGFFINRETLDFMRSVGASPLMKISFDGIGFHNWMRGVPEAEKRALDAISLCIEEKIPVKVQMNVNRMNRETVLPSLELLDEMGVGETRIIRTTDAPRWIENARGQSLTTEEYYDFTLDVIPKYASKPHKMAVTVWQVMNYNPVRREYALAPLAMKHKGYRQSLPVCTGARGMIAVGANGNVYPCMQQQGFFEQQGIVLGNVFTDGLQSVLRDSEYMKTVCYTVGDRVKDCKDCRECRYLKVCGGGCPALGIITNGNRPEGCLLADRTKCVFFRDGYDRKFEKAMKGIKSIDGLSQ